MAATPSSERQTDSSGRGDYIMTLTATWERSTWKRYGRKRLWPNWGASTGKTVENRRKPSSKIADNSTTSSNRRQQRHKPVRYVSCAPLEGKQGVRTSHWMARGSNPGEVVSVQTGPTAHPLSSATRTESLSRGQGGQFVAFTTYPPRNGKVKG